MSNKNKKDEGLGGFIDPLMDLASELLSKLIDLLSFGLSWLVGKVVERLFDTERKIETKKIEKSHLVSKKISKKVDSIGYSTSHKREVPASELNRKYHTMIVGASGYGKSNLIENLIYSDLKSGKPVIYIDPKGDRGSLDRFVKLCSITGRKYRVFSSIHEFETKLALVRDGRPSEIADRIHSAFDWSEEHYSTVCYRALNKAITLIPKGDVSFHSIKAKLLELAKEKESGVKLRDIEGLILRLENISNSIYGEFLGSEGLSMTDIWEKGESLYISLPVLSTPKTSQALGRIILSDLSYAIASMYNRPDFERLSSFGVYIDELSAIVNSQIIDLFNKARGSKLEFNFAFQTLSDLDRVSEAFTFQVMEVASTWFVLKQRNEHSARTLSHTLGTKLSSKETRRIKDGREEDLGSRRDVEELICHTNIIKGLRPGQSILLQQGESNKVELINLKFLDSKKLNKEENFLKSIGDISNHSRKVFKKRGALG